MAITDDLRKTFTDPTPLYFAAGTADIAMQQARKVPALIEKLQAEAPARIDAVWNADPKSVSDRVTMQAKETQAKVTAKVTEAFETFDTDLKKFGENAQDLAMRGVGVAAEYAVKAREAYERVAERGEQSVKQWRGEAAEGMTEFAVAVEPEPTPKPSSVAKPAPKVETRAEADVESKAESRNGTRIAPKTVKADAKPMEPKPEAPRRAATTKKTPPPAGK